MKSSPPRVDWPALRDTIDLARVATNLLGPAPGRRGERGRKLWWNCPFHHDANPSFLVEPGNPWWRCYGCDAHGDAAALVMRLNGSSFPEAVAYLAGGPAPARPGKSPGRRGARPRPAPEPEPSGLPEPDALALVTAASARLWSPEGADALAYLHGRGLDDEMVQAARLGWVPGASIPTRAGDRSYRAVGWVIPWFAGGRLALVKVRQPDGRRPKYAEAFRDPSRLACYPGPETIRPGYPLVIVEGELDALLLGQELADLAPVVTLGSASARPAADVLGRMLAAVPWYVATDNDAAGDKAALGWPRNARRVRPPGAFKDWTEARQAGVDLRRWWSANLAGDDRPPLFTWEELSRRRWGRGLDDDTPGIVVDRPDRDRMLAALEAAARDPDDDEGAEAGDDVFHPERDLISGDRA